eukprot:4856110-Pyramimonas_sp.AAC.1
MATMSMTFALRTTRGEKKHARAKPVVLVACNASSWLPVQRRRARCAPLLPRRITEVGPPFVAQHPAPRSPTR